MEDHNMLQEEQVIFIEEEGVVLDGKEIQYVIPQSIARNGNMLIQEEGTPFTHYLLDAENVTTIGSESETVVQHVEFTNQNALLNPSVKEENQIFEFNTQDQDVVAQVVLSEEQCRILQDFGRVLIQQGSRKFLLDAEGLKEVDPSFDCQSVECILSDGNEICDETNSCIVSSGELNTQESDVRETEEERLEEYIVQEDNKTTVFQFLQGQCDVIMSEPDQIHIEASESIEMDKSSETFFTGAFSTIEDGMERNLPDKVLNSSLEPLKSEKMETTSVQRNSSSSKLVDLSLSNNTVSRAGHSNKSTSKTGITDKNKKSEMSGKGKNLPQIKNGKIVMMPEDANTPYAKKLIKTHFANTYLRNPVKLRVSKSESLKSAIPNKLTLKNLKDYKIYIGSTEDGKNIYGKIINIVKPPHKQGKYTKKDKITKIPDKACAIDCKETLNQVEETITKKDLNLGPIPQPKVINKQSNSSTGKHGSNVTTMDLNKMMLDKETKQRIAMSSKDNILAQSQTPQIQSTSSDDYENLKCASTSLNVLENEKAKVIVPSIEELDAVNNIFSNMIITPKLVSCLSSRDILVMKGQEDGTSEMFTGRMSFTDTDESSWKFNYMPELWNNAEDSGNKISILKKGNFIVLKLIRNESTNITNIVIMDKVKCQEKQAQETMVNQTNKAFKKTILYCPYCKKFFYRMSCLYRHMTVHTTQQAVHKCSYCSCVFRFSCTLTRHIVEVHSGSKVNLNTEDDSTKHT